MSKMQKVKETLKKYSFFDPFPNTDYFAFVPHKTNAERLEDAVIMLNINAKESLVSLHDHLIKEYGYEALGGTEQQYRIFVTEGNDFTRCSWGHELKCEASQRPGDSRVKSFKRRRCEVGLESDERGRLLKAFTTR
ncbi:TPA: hypothetical protein NBH86_000872 [Serratia marcescens]|nr:hypothetical protein [Serratia marcescens]